MYRLLRRENQLKHRSASKPKVAQKPKAVVATGPNEVYTWDITYLLSSVKGCFFTLYMFMDIYSRKIVGYQVYVRENSEYAADLLEATMLATLQRLGVIPSFSRSGVSNDNPYSEALFKTLKYSPKYPFKPFDSLVEARTWVDDFVRWYNHDHLHSGIKFVTPEQRHVGKDDMILKHRTEVYAKAKERMPHRWSRGIRNWKKDCTVL
jgi:transposase InsO family protein